MILTFGLELDDLVFPRNIDLDQQTSLGYLYAGPIKLLTFLEGQLGIPSAKDDTDYLRIEQYRQVLLLHKDTHPDAFYARSLVADEFATATAVLERRDELLMMGWDFMVKADSPARLRTLAEVEILFKENTEQRELGFADRLVRVTATLDQAKLPLDKIVVNEPLKLLPPQFQHLFYQLKEMGIAVDQCEDARKEEVLNGSRDNDLHRFQRGLRERKNEKQELKGDGTLTIIRSKRETEAAAYLARLFRLNKKLRPTCLIPEKNRVLDTAIVNEGLPSMGVLSASLARPSLQILKLVSAFLWKPLDPFKVMEFVSLAVKPLDYELASVIAEEVANSPGINSEHWHGVIYGFFNRLEEKAKTNRKVKVKEIRKQYNFWFKRKRYDINKVVPKSEVTPIFQYLAKWALKQFENSRIPANSLLVLHAQAEKIMELLNALPASETHLTALQLERIVRTIYKPSPLDFMVKEVGSLAYLHQPSALIGGTDDFLWWNFIDTEREQHFPKWYKQETAYLNQISIFPETPEQQNERLLWRRLRPIFNTKKKLFLVIPHYVDGVVVEAHPLLGDLQAIFSNPELITCSIDEKRPHKILAGYTQPLYDPLEHKPLGQPPAYLQVQHLARLDKRDKESFSSLNALFYYPYQWVFRHKIKLRKSSILSVVNERRLMGNLSHRLFELMFNEETVLTWDKQKVYAWIDERLPELFEQEGAVLLLYGKEPDRISFENTVKNSAWALLHSIKSNGWKIKGMEVEMEGEFMDTAITGKADMVLKRGEETAVVDLKWGGAARNSMTIKNKEDLQLVLYADILKNGSPWAHTAYFIIDSAKVIARNNLAFKEAIAVMPDFDYKEINEEILTKMRNTYEWRMSQLREGKIEIRTEHTFDLLDEEMAETEWEKLLEMKDGDARFDDYKSLVSLIG